MGSAELILNYEKRKTIYEKISENPGLHLRELNRNIDFSFGSLRYHLNYLIKKGLVITESDHGFIRYYSSKNVCKTDRKILNLLQYDTIRKILIIFMMNEDKKIFFKEDLIKLPHHEKWYDPEKFVLNKHRTTLDYHLRKLADINVLETINVNGKTGYKLINSEKLWDVFIKYKIYLSCRKIGTLVRWVNNKQVSKRVDPFLDVFYDIFPHPYYM